MAQYRVRPYERRDREAVQSICAATAWLGKRSPDQIPDDRLWADYWTEYFTSCEPQHSWVAQRVSDGFVVGYLNGTVDYRRFERYAFWRLPWLAGYVVKSRLVTCATRRRALVRMLRSLTSGELRLPGGVGRRYPGTFHFNVIAEARGQGIGRQLLKAYVEQTCAEGVPGVHVQVLGINHPTARLLERLAFRRVALWPIQAFAPVDGRVLELATWVRRCVTAPGRDCIDLKRVHGSMLCG